MNFIIKFFRDTLSGVPYFVDLGVSLIIFFACIGYMGKNKVYEAYYKRTGLHPGEEFKAADPTPGSEQQPQQNTQ